MIERYGVENLVLGLGRGLWLYTRRNTFGNTPKKPRDMIFIKDPSTRGFRCYSLAFLFVIYSYRAGTRGGE